MVESKKHKRKTKRMIMLVSDAIDGKVKQHALGVVITWGIIFLLMFTTAVVGLCFYIEREYMISASNDVSRLEQDILDLNAQNESLLKSIEELEERNAILGTTLEEKIKAEEERIQLEAEEDAIEAAKYIPTGLPSNKAVSMNEMAGQNTDIDITGNSTQNADGETIISEEVANEMMTSKNPIVEFVLEKDGIVMATADGTVIMVSEDSVYTNVVRVDHGNGYVSVYRCKCNVVVNVGDTVTKGMQLFEAAQSDTVLGYQIILNADYINPAELMDLKG